MIASRQEKKSLHFDRGIFVNPFA